MNIDPGELDQRVMVEKRTLAKSSGAQRETFSAQGTFWCKARLPTSRESEGGSIDSSQESYTFIFRRSTVTAGIVFGDRLLWNGRYYDIKRRPDLSDRFHVLVIGQYMEPSARDG